MMQILFLIFEKILKETEKQWLFLFILAYLPFYCVLFWGWGGGHS